MNNVLQGREKTHNSLVEEKKFLLGLAIYLSTSEILNACEVIKQLLGVYGYMSFKKNVNASLALCATSGFIHYVHVVPTT